MAQTGRKTGPRQAKTPDDVLQPGLVRKGMTIDPEVEHCWIEGTADGGNWERLVPYKAEADAISALEAKKISDLEAKKKKPSGPYKQFRVSHVKPRHGSLRATEIIAGCAPSKWLLYPLQTYARSLGVMIRAESSYPGRPEQRKRLAKIAAAARLLVRELDDLNLYMLLVPSEGDWIARERGTRFGLNDIAERATTALREIPEGKGKAKHYAREERFQNKDVCALVVTGDSARWASSTPSRSVELALTSHRLQSSDNWKGSIRPL